MIDDPDDRTRTAISNLSLAALAMIPVVLAASLQAGNGWLIAPAISVAFALIGTAARGADLSVAPLLVACAVIGQPIALTAALAGHVWQLDAHMTFFAAFATLVVLRNVAAIVVATALIAVHHVALTVTLPALVYPGTSLVDGLQRSVFHAVVVLVEAGALIVAVRRQQSLIAQNDLRLQDVAAATAIAEGARDEALAASKEAEAQRGTAEEMRRQAEAALESVQAERRAAEDADVRTRAREQEQNAAAERQRDAQRAVMQALGEGLKALASGDLTFRLTTRFEGSYEEVRADFNAALDALGSAVGAVSDQADRMLSDIGNLRSTAADLSDRSERQARSLEQTAASLEEVTTIVRSTAEGAARAAKSAAGARETVQSSGDVVQRTSVAMSSINDSAGEIHKIIDVIDQIAFQTNLLALNAGVEAARAGEAGKGFAVVATEVRELAQRSSTAARDISTLISKSQTHVDEGVRNVGETVASLETVIAAVSEISERIDGIATAAEEQAAGLGEINRTVAQLDGDTQRTSSLSSESAAAAAALTERAGEMKRLTSRFRHGQGASGRRVA